MFWHALGAIPLFQRGAQAMNVSYTYLLVNFLCVIVPLVFSFHPKIKFNLEFKFFFPATAFVALLFIVWDSLFTSWGIWSFNPKFVTGISLFNLPLEEMLFFLCIPFACVFTYHCVKVLFDIKERKFLVRFLSWMIAVFLLVIAFIHSDRLYTVVTFFALAFLLLLLILKRAQFLQNFFLMYLLILLPFFLSNGLLTGMFTSEPVVIYNDNENLSFRIFTIPFEDLFYGMLLLLMNVGLYEFFRSRRTKNYS
jgi:lycopene cyclase domain-containing protein